MKKLTNEDYRDALDNAIGIFDNAKNPEHQKNYAQSLKDAESIIRIYREIADKLLFGEASLTRWGARGYRRDAIEKTIKNF